MTEYISLPAPDIENGMPLFKAINLRRSIRNFTTEPLTLHQISQLVYSAQGVNHTKYRVIPSAGATFPLDLYLLLTEGGVQGLEAGVYHYLANDHVLFKHRVGDFRELLFESCQKQTCVNAPVNIILTGEFSRTGRIYGERAVQYVNQEIGHAGQNISLTAISLGLGSVMVGAFKEQDVIRLLNCPPSFIPLYIIPIGYPK
ncbi:SagB/ThcOx family dehydrogenase [bacterium]|nr:SagB/ThcOx family dehydrogenase [bacterium]